MHIRTIIIPAIILLILAAVALLLLQRPARQPVWVPGNTYFPGETWPTSTPEEQGFDPGKLADALQAIRDENIAIDSLLIIRNGNLILDAYFAPYDGSIPHDLASVTKSVTTTLVGIAADKGYLRLDDPMLSFFPDRTIANLDERKESITVRHLAGMVNGFESGCLEGDGPTLSAMRAQPDWVQAALDRRMVREPGKRFCYDSPGMHILSAILEQATGMTEEEFARQHLFEPLGIGEWVWEKDLQGHTRGWGDLHLYPADAARLGYLFLNGGKWEGRQVVSTEWVEQAAAKQVEAGEDDYGYGWWTSPGSYMAVGRGGQIVRVYPSVQVVVVATASDLDYAQIEDYLTAALADPEKPLPPDTAGTARLAEAVGAAGEPAAFPPGVQPGETAKAIEGKEFEFGENPVGLSSLQLDYSDPTVIKATLDLQGSEVTWLVGMDGKYRLSTQGEGMRGHWSTPDTLEIDVFSIGTFTRTLRFEANRVTVTSPDEGVNLTGQVAAS